MIIGIIIVIAAILIIRDMSKTSKTGAQVDTGSKPRAASYGGTHDAIKEASSFYEYVPKYQAATVESEPEINHSVVYTLNRR